MRSVSGADLRECPQSRAGDLSVARAVAGEAVRALSCELAAWPKPGLVSPVDTGSHRDMDAVLLRTSIAALEPYFVELALAGSVGASMQTLRRIGIRAEAAMMSATGGVNTHRGAIFGLGLLCAAAGTLAVLRSDGSVRVGGILGRVVAERWGQDILSGPMPALSHGAVMLRRHGAGGARVEAGLGFPSVYEVGLPALSHGRAFADRDDEAAVIHACFALIAKVSDTNLLHRGGPEGAAFAADQAAAFLAAGGIGQAEWRAQAASVHAAFVARNLSPGGCADLLAMTLFVEGIENRSFRP
jgi:triphosphoribosyl-dephospho-CoA synthase